MKTKEANGTDFLLFLIVSMLLVITIYFAFFDKRLPDCKTGWKKVCDKSIIETRCVEFGEPIADRCFKIGKIVPSETSKSFFHADLLCFSGNYILLPQNYTEITPPLKCLRHDNITVGCQEWELRCYD